MSQCIKCKKELLPLEKSLHKKLIDKNAQSFYCKKCLSDYIGLKEETLDRMAEYYREIGCMLFKTD